MKVVLQRTGGPLMVALALALGLGAWSVAHAANPNSRTGTWNSCYYLDQGQHYNLTAPIYSYAQTYGSASCTQAAAVTHYPWASGAYQTIGSSGWIAGNTATQYNWSYPTLLIDCYHQIQVGGLQQSPNVNYQAF